MSKKACTGQCHGCAYKAGAAAHGEPDNRLRGIICALGGIPFFCHESLGWTQDKEGYALGALNAVNILSIRPTLLKVGASPELIRLQTEPVRRSLRTCAGWRQATRQLKALGWFTNADLRSARRAMAKSAERDLDGMTGDDVPEDLKDLRMRNLGETVCWFMDEAREARVDISFLL